MYWVYPWLYISLSSPFLTLGSDVTKLKTQSQQMETERNSKSPNELPWQLKCESPTTQRGGAFFGGEGRYLCPASFLPSRGPGAKPSPGAQLQDLTPNLPAHLITHILLSGARGPQEHRAVRGRMASNPGPPHQALRPAHSGHMLKAPPKWP